jgi:hypothetical protein
MNSISKAIASAALLFIALQFQIAEAQGQSEKPTIQESPYSSLEEIPSDIPQNQSQPNPNYFAPYPNYNYQQYPNQAPPDEQ